MKVGDRVVCIREYREKSPIQKGFEYIVNDVFNCKRGQISINIGSSLPKGIDGCECYCNSIVSMQFWYHDKSYFRKVEEKVNYVKLEIAVEEPCLN